LICLFLLSNIFVTAILCLKFGDVLLHLSTATRQVINYTKRRTPCIFCRQHNYYTRQNDLGRVLAAKNVHKESAGAIGVLALCWRVSIFPISIVWVLHNESKLPLQRKTYSSLTEVLVTYWLAVPRSHKKHNYDERLQMFCVVLKFFTCYSSWWKTSFHFIFFFSFLSFFSFSFFSYRYCNDYALLCSVFAMAFDRCLIKDYLLTYLRLKATQRYLPYGSTQCYLPPDTGKYVSPQPQPTDLLGRRGESWIDIGVGIGLTAKWLTCPQTVTHPSTNPLIASRPEVEATTSRLQVQRPTPQANFIFTKTRFNVPRTSACSHVWEQTMWAGGGSSAVSAGTRRAGWRPGSTDTDRRAAMLCLIEHVLRSLSPSTVYTHEHFEAS